MNSELVKLVANKRALVYVVTIADISTLLRLLGDRATSHFHSNENNLANLDDWKQGRKDVLIATNGFGAGVDVKINLVIHYGGSHSPTHYIQETGRAGRGEEKGECYLLTARGFEIKYNNVVSDAIWRFINDSICIRLRIAIVTQDDSCQPCWLNRAQEICSWCDWFINSQKFR